MKELMLSIITVVKNDENNIENTIKSVLSQKSKLTFEYIVLDGGSTDQTFNIIKKYKNKIDFIQSKTDMGLYHALNRAVRLSKGKYIGILHSGDVYSSNYIIEKHRIHFNNKKFDLIFSNLKIVKNNKVFRYYDSSSFKKKHLLYGWMPPHPTCFIKRKKIIEANFYNINYKISSDYDLLLRLFFKYNINYLHIPMTSIYQSRGGLSDRGLVSKFLIFKEIILSLKKNNLYKNFFYIIYRYWFKIKELVKKNDS